MGCVKSKIKTQKQKERDDLARQGSLLGSQLNDVLRKLSVSRGVDVDEKTQMDLALKYQELCKDHKTSVLNKDQLKAQFKTGVDSAVIDKLCALIDPEDTGQIRLSEFVFTVACLNQRGSTLSKLTMVFAMFDTNRDHSLDKEEFFCLVKAAMNVKMMDFIKNPVAFEAFLKHLQHEYSRENMDFLRAVNEYKELSREERRSRGQEVYAKYIADNAESMVNLSSLIRQNLDTIFSQSQPDDSYDLFDDAANEIASMLEKDSFQRFRKNDELIREMVQEFRAQADLDA